MRERERKTIERKLARVPAPRVFPREPEPKSLLQANITIDPRSQITEKEKREGKDERKTESSRQRHMCRK